mmetsp:Transcript_25088/g.56263  ORF Transcript_25088/g.56263 Transcript_25088/m.56263 type:complete len:580 (+) Transcript_25088:88-1827(+)
MEEEVFTYTGRYPVTRNLTHVKFDQSVRVLKPDAFSNCRQLKKVDFNEGLLIIGSKAFAGCQSLESITFPSSLREIHELAFHNCKSLQKVQFNNGLREIGNRCFCYCSSLKGIKLPDTLTRLSGGAFFRCEGIEQVELSRSLHAIEEKAFGSCYSLRSIEIPPSIHTIADEAFTNCRKINTVHLSEGLIQVGSDAFLNCYALEHVRLPGTMKRLGTQAFYFCMRLRTVNLNEGLETIGYNCFNSCNSLLTINIPSTVVEMGARACGQCPLLRNVTISLDNEALSSLPLSTLFPRLRNASCSMSDLRHRFDGLRLHQLCYEYSSTAVDDMTPLRMALEKEHDPISVDCLLMTPLHVLVCGSEHNIDIYRIVLAIRPNFLIDEDAWGRAPLFYGIFNELPLSILEYLFETHQELWGELPFDFGKIATMFAAKVGSSFDFFKELIAIQQRYFRDQPTDWDRVVDDSIKLPRMPIEMLRHLIRVSASRDLEQFSASHKAIVDARIDEISAFNDTRLKTEKLKQIRGLVQYWILQKATTCVELAMWKCKLDELNPEELDRESCRVNCGAEIVMPLILRFFEFNR